MQSYASESEFLTAISGCLPADPDMKTAIVQGIAEAERQLRAEPRISDPGLPLRIGTWVLREEDTPVAEMIGLAATGATSLATPELAATALIASVAEFACLCWRAWRKGARLSRSEITVLGLLKLHGPMRLTDLQEKASTAPGRLSTEEVQKALQRLNDIELRDGTLVELAHKNASGEWRAHAL
jgi:hypothetical protein